MMDRVGSRTAPGAARRVEIVTVMDNYADVFLPSTPAAERRGPPALAPDRPAPDGDPSPLLAEHGLSLWVSITSDEATRSFLFDTGMTEVGVPYNLRRLGLAGRQLDGLILSHGHPDHTAALVPTLRLFDPPPPVYVHPKAFAERYLVRPDGQKLLSNTLSPDTIRSAGAELIPVQGGFDLAPGVALIGDIPMKNEFERGFPAAFVMQDGELAPDLFPDELALVIQLAGRGLIVITGCAHRGVINTVRHARELTPEERVHVVMGGFHLGGATEKIQQTAEELRRLDPTHVIPGHCTGWEATVHLSQALGRAFILSAVGTRFVFDAPGS
ncbi:MAG: MBL fold metallo-hydrolase [Proteobacteria bacterium]|nr:MBL fold metallo-hydrolase [Pseudomonadota bacterium]MBU1742534.1 MBL fold metallo-hydrolase [Pseudomonadota bacterium]